MSEEVLVGAFKAPDNPAEKKAWTEKMLRLHVSVAYVGTKCVQCLKEYVSVDDWLARNPKGGLNPGECVDAECWDAYAKEHPLP